MAFIDFNKKQKLKIWEGINGPVAWSEKITIGQFTIDKDTLLPEHSHPHEQWTNVIEGELEFIIGKESMLLKTGMTAYIPSGIPHSGKAITKCKVIDVFTPFREDFADLDKKSKD